MRQKIDGDTKELAEIDGVSEVKDSCESGIAYVLMCEDYDIQKIRVALLKSDKWTPREGYKNDVDSSNSYIKVTYHHKYLN
jgi:hypothetical protein